MSDLIERLEKATGPSREIDQDIFHELGLCQMDEGACNDYKAPAYTASIDAALTLVPEGWIWDVASTGCVWIAPPDDLDRQIVIGGIDNPKIALCIAALKARGGDKPVDSGGK